MLSRELGAGWGEKKLNKRVSIEIETVKKRHVSVESYKHSLRCHGFQTKTINLVEPMGNDFRMRCKGTEGVL